METWIKDKKQDGTHQRFMDGQKIKDLAEWSISKVVSDYGEELTIMQSSDSLSDIKKTIDSQEMAIIAMKSLISIFSGHPTHL